MKKLVNIENTTQILRIEAARISFEIASLSFADLNDALSKVSDNPGDFRLALVCIRSAWGFIDATFRYSTVVGQIKGFRHKDQRFKEAEKAALNVGTHRNFIQHLQSSIPSVQADIYPITGAISWPSPDLQISYTLSLGKLPSGSQFHSLAYDKQSKAYKNGIVFNLDKHELNISESFNAFERCHEYLNEWLSENNMLDQADSIPCFMKVEGLGSVEGQSGGNFVRVRFKSD